MYDLRTTSPNETNTLLRQYIRSGACRFLQSHSYASCAHLSLGIVMCEPTGMTECQYQLMEQKLFTSKLGCLTSGIQQQNAVHGLVAWLS